MIARDSKTIKIEKAAFSKSVICTSILRNSTRQPIGELGGGGLKRSVCQFVDWMFSKWSDEMESSRWRASLKITRGSRMKRWAMCFARRVSMPGEGGCQMKRSRLDEDNEP